jgi:hypothetical protein
LGLFRGAEVLEGELADEEEGLRRIGGSGLWEEVAAEGGFCLFLVLLVGDSQQFDAGADAVLVGDVGETI